MFAQCQKVPVTHFLEYSPAPNGTHCYIYLVFYVHCVDKLKFLPEQQSTPQANTRRADFSCFLCMTGESESGSGELPVWQREPGQHCQESCKEASPSGCSHDPGNEQLGVVLSICLNKLSGFRLTLEPFSPLDVLGIHQKSF